MIGPQIARPIGRADMEFYESAIVLRMALLLSGYTVEQWDALSYRARQRWLNRAVDASCALFNDANVVAHLPMLARNLQQRAA
jgi:hypothetical protein